MPKATKKTMRLFCSALLKFALGVAVVAALLFISAGTFDYWNAWLFMAILFIPMFIAGIVMMFVSPDLLRNRLNVREEEGEQRTVILLSGLMFVAGFVLAGLNFRFAWIVMPNWISWAGAALFLIVYALYAEVLRENAYLSRTIEVQENQKVVDTGMYGVVRHPMYAVTVVMFIAIPLVLGSLPSLLIFLLYPFIIAKRIGNEEEVLEEGLPGYEEYMQKVRYRLIPFIW